MRYKVRRDYCPSGEPEDWHSDTKSFGSLDDAKEYAKDSMPYAEDITIYDGEVVIYDYSTYRKVDICEITTL